MATVVERERLEVLWEEPRGLTTWISTVDHKKIGRRYLVTAFAFFLAAGIEALLMRTQLAVPEGSVVGPGTFNQLFTLHGVTMIFLFVTPMLSGFGNYFVPLMIGARDMAFQRLNAFGYWVFLGSGLFIYSSVLVGSVPNDGWFNYVPLSELRYTPGLNIDFYGLGLLFLAISTTAGAVNFIVTILKMRAPGMSINRMPLFCWAMLTTSFAIVFALPSLTAANTMLELERKFGFHFFDVAKGGKPVLWQHLFWIFGHPDVYIIFLPAVGIVSTVIPVFARRPIVAYPWLALSTVATGFIGFFVWVHHMFAVGISQVGMAFFAVASFMITIPSGIQVFAWVATVLTGRPVLRTPMLFALGFVVVFVVGGVTGVMFAAIPFDQQITDSYFVVAHFHYVLFGGAVFPILAALHYWFPKVSGRLYGERLGKLSFWLVFLGFNLTFFPMHVSGLLGMPRRVYTYPSGLGWDLYNLLATIGAFLLASGILAIVVNLAASWRRGAPAGPDPWEADTLEWETSSPPPPYDFDVIPTVRSLHPRWEPAKRDELGRELLLAEGHETLATTELDAEPDVVLAMPSESFSPLLLTLALALVFVGLLTELYVVAIVGGALSLLALAAWHATKEEAV
jgi:cytochrome c oxidase subunit 1/cytochrome c oxidase subunit I+III